MFIVALFNVVENGNNLNAHQYLGGKMSDSQLGVILLSRGCLAIFGEMVCLSRWENEVFWHPLVYDEGCC